MSTEAVTIESPKVEIETPLTDSDTITEAAAHNAVIGTFSTHADAEEAVKTLEKRGFPMRSLSIVGQGYHSEERPTGFFTTGDRVKAWGEAGLFWGTFWGLLFGVAYFWVPDIGPIGASGSLVHLLVSALGGAAVVGGVSALGAALVGLGLPKNTMIKYERDLKSDSYQLIAQGMPKEVAKARSLLEQARRVETAVIKA